MIHHQTATSSPNDADNSWQSKNETQQSPAPLAGIIGNTRFVVLLGVLAVLGIAVTLFVLGAWLAVYHVWTSSVGVLNGSVTSTDLTVKLLEVVTIILKAVFFYLIGIGLYSLFVAPLNLPIALGVESLNDLEMKVISVILVIQAVTFLEHFIGWENSSVLLQNGIALAMVSLSLVAFQFITHYTKETARKSQYRVQENAQHELFDENRDRRVPSRQGDETANTDGD